MLLQMIFSTRDQHILFRHPFLIIRYILINELINSISFVIPEISWFPPGCLSSMLDLFSIDESSCNLGVFSWIFGDSLTGCTGTAPVKYAGGRIIFVTGLCSSLNAKLNDGGLQVIIVFIPAKPYQWFLVVSQYLPRS